jgi:hypothetical protein
MSNVINGVTMKHFTREEFRHPDAMDPGFLVILDEWRARLRFSIRIHDDARTLREHHALYRGAASVPDSAHTRGCAIDCAPWTPGEGKELLMVGAAVEMWREGLWPYLGIEVATRHLHFDNDRHLAARGKRPVLFAAVSR